jgi:hypothetical protein
VHELKEQEVIRGVDEYCQWFRGVVTASGEDILNVTLFADEILVYLSSYMNSQNVCISSEINPRELRGTPLYEENVGVYSIVPYHEIRILGPIFFNYTVNLEHYREGILYSFIGYLNEDDMTCGCFQ